MDVRDFMDAMKETGKGPKAFDTQAEVLRIEDETAWVHIPGGAEETPVRLTISAKEGDTVQVRVSNGNAFMVGNASAPPTDDKAANAAQATAEGAAEDALAAIGLAQDASEAAERANGWTNYLAFDESTGLDVGYRENEAKTRISGDGIRFIDNAGGTMADLSTGSETTQTATIVRTFSESAQEMAVGDVFRHNIIGAPTSAVVVKTRDRTSSTYATSTFTEPGTRNVSMSSGMKVTITYDGYSIVCEVTQAGTNLYSFTAEYDTEYYNPTFRMGRDTTVEGGNSTVLGEGTMAVKMAQTAIGTYNMRDGGAHMTRPDEVLGYGQYAFIIGNGDGNDAFAARSNALTVAWDGEIETYLNTLEGRGGTDEELYNALTSAGWNSILNAGRFSYESMMPIKALLAKIVDLLTNLRCSTSITGGTTGKLDLGAASGGVLVLDGGAASYLGIYIVYCASGGTVSSKAVSAITTSNVSITFGTNYRITITNNGSSAVNATFFPTHGTGSWS